MKHLGTQEIYTDRLVLRKFKQSDVFDAFKNWCHDDEVTKYLTWPSHSSVDVTKTVFDEWIKLYANDNYYQWAIVLKEIDEPIGSISVVDINEKTDSVEIGYCIGTKWWHKGIVSEAFKAIISFLFDEMNVKRIEARHDVDNQNSGKVMLKCGLKHEGILRQSDCNNQGVVDLAYYSILVSEHTK